MDAPWDSALCGFPPETGAESAAGLCSGGSVGIGGCISYDFTMPLLKRRVTYHIQSYEMRKVALAIGKIGLLAGMPTRTLVYPGIRHSSMSFTYVQ